MSVAKKSKTKKRKYENRPAWQIILDLLVAQDKILLYRICRKMIIHLNRTEVPEIHAIIENLNPGKVGREKSQNIGENWPKPKGTPFVARDMYKKLFKVADEYMGDEEITALISRWIQQENLNFLSSLLEQGEASLVKVAEGVNRYIKLFNPDLIQSFDEIIGLRVSLINRFLSDNLEYVRIAKKHITIKEIANIIDRMIGPASGYGKLGGKSAGLSLAKKILAQKRKDNPLLKNVSTPKTRFLSSDCLLQFLHYNALEEFVYIKYKDPEAIRQEFSFVEYVFKNSQFPPEIMNGFKRVLDDLEGAPIVVRSSSILEDSFEGSFSGKYKSLFIANIGTKEERLAALIDAISEVYASTFGPDPIAYRSERGLLDFREEMGILIQQVVGNKIGKYFMPSYAGVAFSTNEFSWSPRIKRKDGVLRLVAGMGTRAVDRTIDDYPKLISPGQPGLSVNNRPEDVLRYSQRYIDVINLETNSFETIEFVDLIKDCGNEFPAIEKIVSFNRHGTMVNPISTMSDFKNEDLVVTFNPLIQNTHFIKQVKEILEVLEEAYGGPVDIEFASDGKKLYMLQCRPQSHFENVADVKIPVNISQESKVFTAHNYVSSGIVENIEYVVYVDSSGYSKLQTKEEMYEVGRIVRFLNRELPKGKFILVGPGRWGSKGDIKLGVPVIYSDINNTAMLVEVAREKGGYVPELSFGTHFFQDLVEANIKYLPLYPDLEENVFNEDFLMNSKNYLSEFVEDVKDYESFVKLIKVSDKNEGCSMSVYMDGEENEAVAFIS